MLNRIKRMLGLYRPIDALIDRLTEEITLGYYDGAALRAARRWASKYAEGIE